MAALSTAEDVRVLWLATLQRLIAQVAHDVKDSLNGVSVNLEVIRSRAARSELIPSAVAPFADAAAQQLDRLTRLLDAVLSVGRAEREPLDVAVTLRRVAALSGASSSPADALVEVDDTGAEETTTSLHGDVVRLALAAPLLEAVLGTNRSRRASPVRCTLRMDASGVVVRIAAAGRRVAMPEAVEEALRAAGVRWTAGEGDKGDLSLVFPRA
jgi:signal transduction histidine kinase